MKHILTAAALFAASAALASAATVTTFTDLSTSSTSDGVSYNSETGAITATTSTDLFVSTNSGTNASNYPYYATTVTIVFDYSTVLAAATSITETSNTVMLVTVVGAYDGKSGNIGIGLYNGSIVWTWQDSYYATAVSLTDTDVTATVDESGYLTITLVANSYDVYSSSTDVAYGSRIYLSDGEHYYSYYGLVSGQSTYTEIDINATYVEGVTVTAGSVTDSDTIKSTSETLAAAVPEPSAFGLLAGIGALVLVAARRRR